MTLYVECLLVVNYWSVSQIPIALNTIRIVRVLGSLHEIDLLIDRTVKHGLKAYTNQGYEYISCQRISSVSVQNIVIARSKNLWDFVRGQYTIFIPIAQTFITKGSY